MTLRLRRARARASARCGVRELLALIDTAEENRRWEFLICQSARRKYQRKYRKRNENNVFIACLISIELDVIQL